MTYVQSGWNWYVATFVFSLRREDEPLRYFVRSELLYAEHPEIAYHNAINRIDPMPDHYRDDDGCPVEVCDIGLYDLDNLQTEELEDGDELASIQWTSASVPPIRKRAELTLFDQYYANSPILNDPPATPG